MRKIKQFRSCPHPTTTLLLFQKLIDEERNLQIQCPSNNRPELFQYPLEILESASVNFLFPPSFLKRRSLNSPVPFLIRTWIQFQVQLWSTLPQPIIISCLLWRQLVRSSEGKLLSFIHDGLSVYEISSPPSRFTYSVVISRQAHFTLRG